MNSRNLTDLERRDWLRLARTDQVGPVAFRQLLRRFGSAHAALEALPALALRGGKVKLKIPSISEAEDEIAQAQNMKARLIAWCEPDYPEALTVIEDAPPIITIRGHSSWLHKRSIALLGAREASAGGRKIADLLARELGEHEIVVTSGLARGIDTAAHQAALSRGTVAVLPGGVDIVYPSENQSLYDHIAEQGCLLSDQPLGREPYDDLFMRRNRLITGLSLGLVVIEAPREASVLLTAKMALDQGREIFAVPGSPLEPQCAGSNDLLRQGAVLCERADDILTHIQSLPRLLAEPPANDFDAVSAPVDENVLAEGRRKILENLGPTPLSIDELVRICHLSPSVILIVLLELELAGKIERQIGQRVVLAAQ